MEKGETAPTINSKYTSIFIDFNFETSRILPIHLN